MSRALAPSRSRRVLDAAHRWLERHNRRITVVVSLAFGVWFLWKGIAGLMATSSPPLAAAVAFHGSTTPP